MKLEALDHPKTLELASQLEVELPTAIGYLELFWAFVAKKTPRGDVGKWSDGVIASACMWRGKASVFVQALTTAGFIEGDSDYRLLVHDWSQHCPNWVRAKLKKDGTEFALKTELKTPLKTGSYVPPQEGTSVATSVASSRADLNQGKAREGKPSQAHTRGEVPRETLSPEFFDFIVETYPHTLHRKSFEKARGSASIVVSTGRATEDDLRRRLIGFRAFADGGGFSGPDRVPTPQTWFNHEIEDPYWAKEWEAPKSKAQVQQDANIDAGQRWLAESA